MSPTLSKAIAIGYVLKEFSDIGNEVFVQVRNKQIKAKVVSLPFVNNNIKKKIQVCFSTDQFEKYADGISTVVIVDLLGQLCNIYCF